MTATAERPTPRDSELDPYRFVRKSSWLGYPLAIALMAIGAGLVLAGFAGLGEAGDEGLHDGVAILVTGAVSMVVGLVWSRRVRPCAQLTSRQAMSAVTAVWVLMIAVSAAGFIATGQFGVADALFESASGFTTTGMTSLIDPASSSRSILLWRALSQWLGGLGVLLVGFGLLPLYGGAYFVRAGRGRPGPSGILGSRFDQVLRRTAIMYGGFTIVMVLAYGLAGVGGFDAVVLSLTTVSTGGFTNRAGSFASYDSATLEWVAIAGMVVAGSSIAVLWWALSGSIKRAYKSIQLRSYLAVLFFVSLLTAIVNGGDATAVRRSIFTVVSFSTTTGFEVVDPSTWHPFLDSLLFSLMVVGAMSGSPGGGLHISRVRLLLLYLRRVLYLQVHPNIVTHVKANGRTLDEYVITNMVGVSVLYGALAMVGSVGVASFGSELHVSFIAAISALSNVGPVFGVDEVLTDAKSVSQGVTGLSGFSRFVLAGLMIAGRLGVYPALVALGDLIEPIYARLRWTSHFLGRRQEQW